jgi:hypothetical protein
MKRSHALMLLLLAGCGGAPGGGKLARVRSETLPNGAIRRLSEGPTAWTADRDAGRRAPIPGTGRDRVGAG